MTLRIAIAKKANPVYVRFRVKNQTTTATTMAGSRMKSVCSIAIIITARISRRIRTMISPVIVSPIVVRALRFP